MKKNKVSHAKFIETYEKYIKEDRKNYYKRMINNSHNSFSNGLSLLFTFLPPLCGLMVIVLNNFEIVGHIVALVVVLIICIILKVIQTVMKLDLKNQYIDDIRKLGYFSVQDYEEKLKKYITGPGGYYELLLQDLMKTYNLTEQTKKINGLNGEVYYIWASAKQDKIFLLNSKTNDKPEIISINVAHIRYFRVDYVEKFIVLKTDITDYYFNMDSLETLNDLIKEKRFENIKGFTPDIYINDFELYMHHMKEVIGKDEKESRNLTMNLMYKGVLLIVGIALLLFINYLVPSYSFIIKIIDIICLFSLFIVIKDIIFQKKIETKSEDDYIKILNTNRECVEHFHELKIALGIKEDYDTVYTQEGFAYLTWVANGYFHVFLNLIYFNVVYMAINLSDVMYFAREKNECLVKLKDKTLSFTKEAETVFAKILPNKDYNWLKGLKNV